MDREDMQKKIHHDYEIIEEGGGYVTIWYDAQGVESYRSLMCPLKKLAEEAATFLKARYAQEMKDPKELLAMVNSERAEREARILETFYQFHPFTKPNGKWYLRWSNSSNELTRISDMEYNDYYAAQAEGRKIRDNVVRRAVESKSHKPLVYRKYAGFKIIPDNSSYWIEYYDSNGNLSEKGYNGYVDQNAAFGIAANKIAHNGDIAPTHTHTQTHTITGTGAYRGANTNIPIKRDKTWNEKWIDGISRWFPDGVPDDIIVLLK
jgi:hypothetical protein